MQILELLISALSQGMLYAPMALGVFIAFRVLNTADLTIDGSFVFGMTVCAMVTISGHPILALFCALIAGALAGSITGLLQTKVKINPILSGILTMTGLYTFNFMILGGQSNRYLQYETVNENGATIYNSSMTIYKMFSSALPDSFKESKLTSNDLYVLILTFVIVLLCAAILAVFFKTRPGMALRATGDNEEMVRASSINADAMRIMGIMISNALVALSGGLICESQRYADLNCGSSMLVVGLASVIIGQVLFGTKGVTWGIVSAISGSLIYRIILQVAYKIKMPSYAVKLLSALIVIVALAIPVLRKSIIEMKKRNQTMKERISQAQNEEVSR